tara:strand:+ start:1100 stop:1375 length:276 start_codon:yes stop_codon:yes gene_type:complete
MKEETRLLKIIEKQRKEIQKYQDNLYVDNINKEMANINTFQCCEGELYLRGSDEYGKDFQVCFNAYDFLNWIDTEQIEYIKEQLIKHIKSK